MGNFESLSGETFYNETESIDVDCFVKNRHCTENPILRIYNPCP